jgi:hypothetical protein
MQNLPFHKRAQSTDRKLRSVSDGGTQDRSVFLGVQILRGLAAFLVLLQHDGVIMAERALDPSFKIEFGQCGVDIFFAIWPAPGLVDTRLS